MIVPFILTAIGAVFRFTNLNWDMGGRLHPDEALIVNGALAIKFFSHVFPGFHDYNGLSVYLLKSASLIASTLLQSPYWSATPEGVTLVGRFVSALLATASIPLIYTIAKRLWNKEIGMINFSGRILCSLYERSSETIKSIFAVAGKNSAMPMVFNVGIA